MRALFKPGPRAGLEWVERPHPGAPGFGEVLVRVLRTGICGTDLHIEAFDAWAQRHLHPPMIPGHEFYGEVVDIGAGVRETTVGDRVSAEGHIVCGTCRNCRAGRRQMCVRVSSLGVDRDGAFAEYVLIPAANVWLHTPGTDPDIGAIFDPFGNAMHTAQLYRLAGEDVLITGAGPIGLMTAAIARHVGARYVVITDISPQRLELARKIGVDVAVDVSTTSLAEVKHELGMEEGFDIGLEISGAPSALTDMIDNLRHGGQVAMLGLPTQPINVDWPKVVTHMLTIRGVYGREMYESWNAMSAMLESSPALRTALDTIITDRYPATEWQAAFHRAREGTSGKVVLDWEGI